MLAVVLAAIVAVASAACDPTTCPASGTQLGAYSFNCVCSFGNASSVNFQRVYTIAELTQPAYVWTTYNFNTTNATFTSANATVVTYNVNASSPLSASAAQNNTILGIGVTAANSTSVVGEFSLITEGNLTLLADYSVSISVVSLPCVPTAQVNGNLLSVNTLGAAYDSLIGYPVTVLTGPALTVNTTNVYNIPYGNCAIGSYSVTSQFINPSITCPQSFNIGNIPLTAAPTQPASVLLPGYNVTAGADGNSTLLLFPTWQESNGSACTPNQVSYTVTVSAGSATATPFAGPFLFVPGTYFVVEGFVIPTSLSLSTIQPTASLSNSVVYYLNVWATTQIGNSPVQSVSFTLPGYQPQNDSSSGLSNTVIAGIAVGATVGVVALALIIYKCSAGSRSGYENIKGGESHA